jgi:hydrogenase small subunit
MQPTVITSLASGETIGEHLARCGVSRRRFLRFCGQLMVAAPAGLALTSSAHAADVARAVARAPRPSVIWLHFQECTGCTESLLRTSHPALADLILDLISLDYHETLMAAAGRQAEDALAAAMAANAGKYVCVVEGAIPTRDDGLYCKIAGRPAIEMLQEVAGKAGAVIAIGSCASWGGIQSADPNPTGARGVPMLIRDKPVVTLPGCPSNPYNFLGTVLEYVAIGKLPALDELGRPLFAYGRVIHDQCPRRPHFDAGRFVQAFGDEGHRLGWCLYKMGCKGPVTHANCSVLHFGDMVDAWPIGTGHPCVGCTEPAIAFRVPLHDTVEIARPTPPDTYAPVAAAQGHVSAIAAGVAGAAVGALVGAGWMAARGKGGADDEPPRADGEG